MYIIGMTAMSIFLIFLCSLPLVFIIENFIYTNWSRSDYIPFMMILSFILALFLTFRILLLLFFARRKVFGMYNAGKSFKKIKEWISNNITKNGRELSFYEFNYIMVFSFLSIAFSMVLFRYIRFDISKGFVNIIFTLAISVILSLFILFLIHNAIRILQLNFIKYFRDSSNEVCKKVASNWKKHIQVHSIFYLMKKKFLESFKYFVESLPFSKVSRTGRKRGRFLVKYHHMIDTKIVGTEIVGSHVYSKQRTEYIPQTCEIIQPKTGVEITEFSCPYCGANFKAKASSHKSYKKSTLIWLMSLTIISLGVIGFYLINLINKNTIVLILCGIFLFIIVIIVKYFNPNSACHIIQVDGDTGHDYGVLWKTLSSYK